ncbi:hypothetical protein AVEN_84594-1 [Araneus ventricosus]|uniref:Uncharacterized protein n=1 Tax=Araneus ventricosus TaxID=182803 RepID=A0A4Y2C445_ARAVE|nr:hypothetical protein AVEN_84594-1 [Araneus ventricosus]
MAIPKIGFRDETPAVGLVSNYLKSKVYLGGFPTLKTLKDKISRVVLSIPVDILRSVVENVEYKMQCEVHKKVGHIEKGLHHHRGSAFIN